MKKPACLLALLLASALLVGCQPVKETIKAEETAQETEPFQSETLLEIGEIAQVEVIKKKGVDPVIYEEAADLATFDDIFSSAAKEPGIANMSDPDFYLKAISDSGEKQNLRIWIGDEGEQASLMREDDTHTIYSLSAEMAEKLAGLIEKEA